MIIFMGVSLESSGHSLDKRLHGSGDTCGRVFHTRALAESFLDEVIVLNSILNKGLELIKFRIIKGKEENDKSFMNSNISVFEDFFEEDSALLKYFKI